MKDTILRNRYRIVQFLGSGSFGDTYIAEDLDLPSNPKCVVKQLKPKTSKQEVLLVARRLFESEAKFLYHLGNLSNQIPKLFAHFEENGEFYLVQEFIDGYELTAEIIPGSQWSEGDVVKLLQEILQILTVVHQENIIHRDIKPQNLIRRHDGKIVMIDFGAVKEIKGLAANTQGQVTSTIAIGSNGYMPNEQANSKPKLCSDIYAVGVIGIQALTGKLPQNFQEDPTNGEIIWQHEANVSKKLADVLTKMVRYNFSQRYQTATEALQALTSLPPPLPLPKLKPATWRFLSNRKVILTGGAVLIMFVSSIYIVSVYTQKRDTLNPQPVITESPPTVITASPPKIEKFSQLPCDNDEQLSSPPTATEKPTWETSIYKYYGDINPKTKEANGRGLMVFKNNGFQYYGDLKNNKRDGCGRFSYPVKSNINYYLGQFKDDKFQGLGRLKLKNQNEYRGNFVNNKCQGKGVYVFKDKTEQDGSWREDKLEGSEMSCKSSSAPVISKAAFLAKNLFNYFSFLT
ncbi:protein kinase domain-containing protein [Nostoc mirabile]|uniref:protein kinase domain-containing protein n=1 Tax=Nostoc mirabile TaxID=2907820 RepID=UPI003557D016